ncbi:Phosphoenolpyruvate carboxykinase [Bacillus cereus]|nr:Phosphoenolpyruvate carboxykinase [Bacillus cereus]
MKKKHMETALIHHGYTSKEHKGSLTPPLFQTSTFTFETAQQGEASFAGVDPSYIYSRLGNPTVKLFEERMAVLEVGEEALAFGSGMAAISATLIGFFKSWRSYYLFKWIIRMHVRLFGSVRRKIYDYAFVL